MKCKIYLVAIALVFCFELAAQINKPELYMPLEFKKAFEKGTRKTDGKVSDNYWQNKSQYKIDARIYPETKILDGKANITYTNSSTDTLGEIVFHAYNDYYKLGSIRTLVLDPIKDQEIITDGLVVKELKINNELVQLSGNMVKKRPTCYVLKLTTPLLPKSKLEMEIDWSCKIPGKGFNRSGASDSTSMFIGQWYPEIAVYDDIDGWDILTYDGEAEFYHDYSDYQVTIEAPDNFLVWASVAPENDKEIFPDSIYSRIISARKDTIPVKVFSENDFGKLKLKTNKWKFSALNFPDFSFALSDHYVWETCAYQDMFGEFILNSAYDPKHKLFSLVIQAEKESMKIFHGIYPKYQFPFRYFTIFNGDEMGMEYPGMAHDSEINAESLKRIILKNSNDYDANLWITSHEMCHSYFPFLTGLNEKKYSWMDEGLACFSADFIHNLNVPDFIQTYTHLASERILPLMTPSNVTPNHFNEGFVGTASFQSLYFLLGKELFYKCLKEFMDRWKYKHPIPYDMFCTFNNTSGQNLNWFWKAWYFDWGYIDLGIASFSHGLLTIKNEGGRPIPFKIICTYKDGTVHSEIISPLVWKDKNVFQKRVSSFRQIDRIQIKRPVGIDAVKENNYWSIDVKI